MKEETLKSLLQEMGGESPNPEHRKRDITAALRVYRKTAKNKEKNILWGIPFFQFQSLSAMTAIVLISFAMVQLMSSPGTISSDLQIEDAPITTDSPTAERRVASNKQPTLVESGVEEVVVTSARIGEFNSNGQAALSVDVSRGLRPTSVQTNSVTTLSTSGGYLAMERAPKPHWQLIDAEEFPSVDSSRRVFVDQQPVSTFSIDVDTASYSLIRREINAGRLPPHEMVRPEELLNYFDYNYERPSSMAQPIASEVSVLDSPWSVGRKLVHIGVQGYESESTANRENRIVLLVDVSGSMRSSDKLNLVKQSIRMLLKEFRKDDRIAIVTYAGATRIALESTPVSQSAKIIRAITRLDAGGSTAGAAGLRLAYSVAAEHFAEHANNRVFIFTDGDFNVGESSNEDLLSLVKRHRDQGVFLNVLGFGRGNYQDDMMQTLAHNGNGIAAYIDNLNEARKVLLDEAHKSLFTIAKDVKIQVEFNPSTVSDYRLVGYETRALVREDFNNDKVDAGEMGAGHSVTAIFEITPIENANQNKMT